MSEDNETFLGRWSRRKRGIEPETPQVAPADDRPAECAETAPAENRPTPPASDKEPMLTEADFADVNFDALDFTSDYGRFMQANVPDAIRNRALRKLWVSDPVLANMDGLHDYFGDYTDAAVAIPTGSVLQTAYKYGQGFLSDEEAAVWDRLGKPVEAEKPEAAEAVVVAVEEKQPDQEQRPLDGAERAESKVVTPPAADASEKT